jgi:uncharacterized delta-60 repeat protein
MLSVFARVLVLATATFGLPAVHAASRDKAPPPTAPRAPAPLVVDETYAPLLEEPGGGIVTAAVLRDDGRAVIGGTFEFVNDTARRYFAGLLFDGAIDDQFAVAGGPDAPVAAMLALPDGGLLVGGRFRTFAGQRAAGLVRLRADGSVDPDFHAPTRVNGGINILARQADGLILVGGAFDHYDGATVPGLVRLQPDGARDESFRPAIGVANKRTVVTSIATLPDGGLAVTATHTALMLPVLDLAARPAEGVPALSATLSRLNADGSAVPSFQRQRTTALVPSQVFALPDGALLLAGSGELQRLDPNGEVDGRFVFEEQGKMQVNVGAVLADGRVLVGGSELPRASLAARLMTLGPRGRIATRFVMPRDQHHAFYTLSRNARGRMLVAGRVAPAVDKLSFTKTENRVLVLDENFGVDRRFNAAVGASGQFSAAAPDGRGGLTLAGSFKSNEGLTGIGLVRVRADGTIDRNFAPSGKLFGLPHLLVPLLDGGVIVGGIVNFDINVKVPRPVIRLRNDGSLEPKFVPDIPVGGYFTDGTLLKDSTVVLVGTLAGRTYDRAFADLVRFDLAGKVDRALAETVPSWLSSSSGRLVAVAETESGHILVGGEFTHLQGFPRAAIARIGAQGVVDGAFVPQTDDFAVIGAIIPLDDQRLFVDGWAKPTAEKPLVRRFTRLLGDGRRDPSYTPPDFSPREPVLARVLVDGTTLVVLHDPTPEAPVALRLVRLDRNGALLPGFDLTLGNHSSSLRILQGQDGAVYLVGNVPVLNGAPRHGLARLVPRR